MSKVKEMVKNNYQLSKNLNPVNETIYTDMICYLRTSRLDELEVEEINQEILGMLICAQERGEDAEAVVGEDYKAFCDAIIESAQPNRFTLRRAIGDLHIVIKGIIFLWLGDLLVNNVPTMIKEGRIILDYSVNLGFLLSTSIILFAAFFIVNYIGQNSFKLTEEIALSKGLKGRLIFGIIVGGLFALVVLVSYKLHSYVLFTTKVYYIAVVLAVMYILVRSCQKHLDYQ